MLILQSLAKTINIKLKGLKCMNFTNDHLTTLNLRYDENSTIKSTSLRKY
jgi:hypothetical protein